METKLPTDSRLPRVLHVLLHLDQIDEPATSDQIGEMLATNPSLIRRMMAGLRQAGFVGSTKGHGGGWFLAKPLNEISLFEVYEALGAPQLFAVGLSADAPACLLEQAANAATRSALAAAKTAFKAELAQTMVADLVAPHSGKIKQYQSNRKKNSTEKR